MGERKHHGIIATATAALACLAFGGLLVGCVAAPNAAPNAANANAASAATANPDPQADEEVVAASFTLATYPSEEIFVAPVFIDGRGPFPFLIDTGSSISAVFEHSIGRMGDGVQVQASERLVRGLISAEARPEAQIASLRLGDRDLRNHRVIVLPRPVFGDEIDGIIGMDVLRDYAVRFDRGRDALTFIPSATFSAAPYRTWDRIDLVQAPYGARDFGLHFAIGTFERGESPVLFDTGTTPSVMNWEAASFNTIMRKLRRSIREQYRLEGSIETTLPTVKATLPTIRMGDHQWRTPTMLVLDLAPLEVLGGEGNPLIIAGADMLSQRTFVIDFANDVMFIDPQLNGESTPIDDITPRGAAAGEPR